MKEIPRFHAKEVVSPTPEGMILVKFHGKPAFIPELQEGEEMFGNSPFTVRQVEVLTQLEQERIVRVRAELAKENPGAF